MEGKVFYTGENCIGYVWVGVTETDEAQAVKCDSNVPVVVQVRGEFSKVSLEGSCDGKEWDNICVLSMQGIKKIDIQPLFIRPKVLGGEATITVNIRR